MDRLQAVTVAGGQGPLAGPDQSDVRAAADAAIAIGGGRILAVGPREGVLAQHGHGARRLDLEGRAVVPGFVDAHTHPVWAGSRVEEFEMRLEGASYLEIMAAGGGIASTVRATRAATSQELLAALLARLDRMLQHGTTTCEAKTGYGLSTAEELRQLDVLAAAASRQPVRLVPTFLGAHALPAEYRSHPDDYIDLVVEEMLPAVASAHPGVFCDVFCDEGAFDLAQTERVLRRARSLGLRLKAHSDEFACLGCTALAAKLGATSVDHLAVTSGSDMAAMARHGTVAVLLPGTTFGLGSQHYADARAFVAHGVPVALGSDLNPGTCPCASLPFMMALACRYMHMSPAGALVAITRNSAHACGAGADAGRLEAGWPADLVVLDTEDYRELAYWIGTEPIAAVMIGGEWRTQAPGAPESGPPHGRTVGR